MKKILSLVVNVLVILGMLASATPAFADSAPKVKGLIASVDAAANTVSITANGSGATVVLNVGVATSIRRNGKTVALAGLQAGDLVEASYDSVSMVAKKIEAKLNLVEAKGMVTAVDAVAGTVDIQKNGSLTSIRLLVDGTTVITRNKVAATIGSIGVGELVEAKYNPVTMLANMLLVSLNLVEAKGVITAVDAGAGTVTIQKNPGLSSITVYVDGFTVITRNKVAATLGSLVVGDLAELKYNPVTMLANRISAGVNVAELKGTLTGVDLVAGTITVTPANTAVSKTISLDSATVVTRFGFAVTLDALVVGDLIEAKFTPVSSLAYRVDAKLNSVSLKGVLKSVDLDLGTFTVTSSINGVDVTLETDGQTVFKKFGILTSLSGLVVGDLIEAKYNPISLLAYQVEEKLNLVELKGTLTDTDTLAGTLTVYVTKTGATVVLSTNGATAIYNYGVVSTLANLAIGDAIEARYNPITLLANRVDAKLNIASLSGTLTAVDLIDGKLSVLGSNGATTVLTVTDATVIKRLGYLVTLADLQDKDRVEVKYNPYTGVVSMIDARLNILDFSGSISAKDDVAHTITVYRTVGALSMTVTVNSFTLVTVGGKISTFDALVVGNNVEVKYNLATMIASRVSVKK